MEKMTIKSIMDSRKLILDLIIHPDIADENFKLMRERFILNFSYIIELKTNPENLSKIVSDDFVKNIPEIRRVRYTI